MTQPSTSTQPKQVPPVRRMANYKNGKIHQVRRIKDISRPKHAVPEEVITGTLCGNGLVEEYIIDDWVDPSTPLTCLVCLKNLQAEEALINKRVSELEWVR